MPDQPDDWRRVVVSRVRPEVEAGRFPIKRVVGESVEVVADVFLDGHDVLRAVLLHRPLGASRWSEVALEPQGNDRWQASFVVGSIGRHEYTVEAWVDDLASWRSGVLRKVEAGESVEIDLQVGADLLRERGEAAESRDREALRFAAGVLGDADSDLQERLALLRDPVLRAQLDRNPDRRRAERYARTLQIVVDPPLARCSAWYEFFPRSTGPGNRHGTFRDAVAMLDYVADAGFDIVYLPPIHPIGRSHRKGPNNTLEAGPDDPGSPWAIGAAEGGHKSVHPELGTLQDFDAFVSSADESGLEVALDIALQCSPDHPYVHEHPEWFRKRPDGSIQYAENPPKKYQDICPFDFECDSRAALWDELASIFEFWCERGIRVFRVDNPHTKPFAFWEWCIARVKALYPATIFLSEAFTRPKVMYRLAKLGFSQSYTYFSWRRHRQELVDYMEELTRTEVAEFFRPNFWPTTPDILPDDLWGAGRGAFVTRLVLAALLSANYGIYGPAFELLDNTGRPGSGEHLDNEKYQIKDWDLDRQDSLRPTMRKLNRIRREHPALQRNDTLRFHDCDNPSLLCFSKEDPESGDVVLVVVNLDYHHRHSGWIDLDPETIGVDETESYQVHDLLGHERFSWCGRRNYVELDPQVMPAHVFLIRRFVRREQDFDYFA